MRLFKMKDWKGLYEKALQLSNLPAEQTAMVQTNLRRLLRNGAFVAWQCFMPRIYFLRRVVM